MGEMRGFIAVAFLCALAPVMGQVRMFEPDDKMISEHRAKVYQLGRDYIVETFNLDVIEEGSFNPVRFNSMGVWGDFEVRMKELGDDRYEVQGWVVPTGQGGRRLHWSVIVKYLLEDPNAWQYRRLDREYPNVPEYLGWKLGSYNSSPYNASYTPEFEQSITHR